MNKELLTELFSTDKDLLSMYHIEAPNSAEICAERTLKDMKDANVEIVLITKDIEVIGYYGVEKFGKLDFLTGFFLKPENRSKEQISKFWNEVDSKFTNGYLSGVYSKNTRAIEFLNKKATSSYKLDDIVIFQIGR